MKNKLLLAILILLFTLSNFPAWAGQENIKLSINGEILLLEDKPLLISDRTLVPLRVVSENLGGMVDWNNEDKIVTITFADKNIIIPIDSKEVKVNGTTMTIDVPAKIINNRTYTPIRFISEVIGNYVAWDEDSKTVHIGTGKNQLSEEKQLLLTLWEKTITENFYDNYSITYEFELAITDPKEKVTAQGLISTQQDNQTVGHNIDFIVTITGEEIINYSFEVFATESILLVQTPFEQLNYQLANQEAVMVTDTITNHTKPSSTYLQDYLIDDLRAALISIPDSNISFVDGNKIRLALNFANYEKVFSVLSKHFVFKEFSDLYDMIAEEENLQRFSYVVELTTNGKILTDSSQEINAYIVEDNNDLVQFNYLFKSKQRELDTIEIPEYFYLREATPSSNDGIIKSFLTNLMFLPLK